MKKGQALTKTEKRIMAELKAEGHQVNIEYDSNGNRSFRTIKAAGRLGPILRTAADGGVTLQ